MTRLASVISRLQRCIGCGLRPDPLPNRIGPNLDRPRRSAIPKPESCRVWGGMVPPATVKLRFERRRTHITKVFDARAWVLQQLRREGAPFVVLAGGFGAASRTSPIGGSPSDGSSPCRIPPQRTGSATWTEDGISTSSIGANGAPAWTRRAVSFLWRPGATVDSEKPYGTTDSSPIKRSLLQFTQLSVHCPERPRPER
ncbi:hypothetical protein BH11PSE2_BH11PSE2_13610 [soil metagenome]